MTIGGMRRTVAGLVLLTALSYAAATPALYRSETTARADQPSCASSATVNAGACVSPDSNTNWG